MVNKRVVRSGVWGIVGLWLAFAGPVSADAPAVMAMAKPPVQLPAGSQLGGAFEPGRYVCKLTLSRTKSTATYEFYENGEWRKLGLQDGALGSHGRYVTVPRTGRLETFREPLTNNRYHPDDDFAVYYRTARNVSHLYGHGRGTFEPDEAQCTREGPVQGTSPNEVKSQRAQAEADAKEKARVNAAALAKKNMQPPSPGGTRWEGLYGHEKINYTQRVDPGFGGDNPQLLNEVSSNWRFLEFQKNGWVYLGLRPPQAPCQRPEVMKDGEPLCTTYSVDGGRLRVGHDDWGPMSQVGSGFKVGGKVYRVVPPLTSKRLVGSYRSTRCEGNVCNRLSWLFGSDGRFTVIGYDQAFGLGIGPATEFMFRGWAGGPTVKGRYRIEGQGLRLTRDDGVPLDIPVFLQAPRDAIITIGDREFLRF